MISRHSWMIFSSVEPQKNAEMNLESMVDDDDPLNMMTVGSEQKFYADRNSSTKKQIAVTRTGISD
jgi:hypothetical protein